MSHAHTDPVPPLQDPPVDPIGDPVPEEDPTYPPSKPVQIPPAPQTDDDHSLPRTIYGLMNPRYRRW